MHKLWNNSQLKMVWNILLWQPQPSNPSFNFHLLAILKLSIYYKDKLKCFEKSTSKPQFKLTMSNFLKTTNVHILLWELSIDTNKISLFLNFTLGYVSILYSTKIIFETQYLFIYMSKSCEIFSIHNVSSRAFQECQKHFQWYTGYRIQNKINVCLLM